MSPYNAYLDVAVYQGMFPKEALVELETESGNDLLWIDRAFLKKGRLLVHVEERGHEYSTVWLPGPAAGGGHVVRVPSERLSGTI